MVEERFEFCLNLNGYSEFNYLPIANSTRACKDFGNPPPPFQRIHMICCYEIIHMHTCIRPMHTYRFFFLEEDLPVKRILRIYIKMVINEIWNIPVIMHINENLLNEMNIDFKKRDLDHAALLMFNG